MKIEKQIPGATYHFHGNVGNQIHYVETLNVAFDKDMNMQIQTVGEVQTHVQSNPAAPVQTSADINPSSLIFKADEQNRPAVEALLKEALSISNKKSVVCRKLYEQRELYNLHTQDDTTKAIIINMWVKRFGLERHFKADFSRKDFGNYYCKS